MATEKIKINSEVNLYKALKLIKDWFEKHHYIHVTVSDKRSLDQNALQFFWYEQLEKQGDMSRKEYRAYCKYHFGIPVLADDPQFKYTMHALKSIDWPNLAAKWGLDVEWAKIAFVEKLEITSLMDTEQMKRYLEGIKNYFEPKGFVLPNKDDL